VGSRCGFGACGNVRCWACCCPGGNHVVSVPTLVEALWGAAPPPTAEKTLQTYVARLRGLLEPDRGLAGPSVLVTASSGYCLRAEAEAVDAALFELLVGKGARALSAGAPELALARLRRALALWRGEAYEDLPDAAFATAERSRLSELRLAATADRIDAELALGGAAGLVGELQRLVAEHPLQERFWGQLIVAFYQAGRQPRRGGWGGCCGSRRHPATSSRSS
jgi:DNA-binding SARP family transcriptional activator